MVGVAEASTAIDHVVPGPAKDRVKANPAIQAIVAALTKQKVVVDPAVERVVARPAAQRVIAIARVDGDRRVRQCAVHHIAERRKHKPLDPGERACVTVIV